MPSVIKIACVIATSLYDSSGSPVDDILLETGFAMLNENGLHLLLE
jgi:hypothetical protein